MQTISNQVTESSSLFMHDGGPAGLSENTFESLVQQIAEEWIHSTGVKRLLILPPDHTRLYSYAGKITQRLWTILKDQIEIDILPALGTHLPMTESQLRMMFGDEIPLDRFIPHDWRNDLEHLGTLPEEFLTELSGGKMKSEVDVAVNKRIVSGDYDLAISVGQVVPHEVIGFANHTKNICIGCGGGAMLHQSHFLGAVCGIESVLGRVDTPVRTLMDEGFYRFVQPKADVRFILTVVEDSADGPRLRAMSAGAGKDCFRWAADIAGDINLTKVDRPLDKCVVYLDPREFCSTWLGNKAIYRTRKAMADDGELIVLAPALDTFGEDAEIDRLIRKYGYRGTPGTLAAIETDAELANNLSAAAHLIHGSTEGRFEVTYCPGDGLSSEEITSVGYKHRSFDDVIKDYDLDSLSDGWNEDAAGNAFYFIRNPALGLWSI